MKEYEIEERRGIFYGFFPAFKERKIWAVTSFRKGGVSFGRYATLNTGYFTDDWDVNIIINRRRFCSIHNIRFTRVVTLKQVHGKRIITPDKPAEDDLRSIIPRKKGDGFILSSKIPVAVFTADCVPLFLFETEQRIKGLLHIGWRGLYAGIIEEFFKKLLKMGGAPDKLIVGIGPSIRDCCYEVQPDFKKFFNEKFFKKRNGRLFFSLQKVIIDKLVSGGVKSENIFDSKICTYCEEELCYSYRRDGKTGRMMSIIF